VIYGIVTVIGLRRVIRKLDPYKMGLLLLLLKKTNLTCHNRASRTGYKIKGKVILKNN